MRDERRRGVPAMVPGLVLFKVMEISGKKEQMHGFHIQIKNILMTFPSQISWFWWSFPKKFMILWCLTDFYNFGRFLHKISHLINFLLPYWNGIATESPVPKKIFAFWSIFITSKSNNFWKKNKFGSLKNLQNTFEAGVFFTEL